MSRRDCEQAPLTVVGIGEALFDCFDDRQVLGGAPVNLVVHAHQLLSPEGGRALIVSRVGRDALGDNLIGELHSRGVVTGLIQRDPIRPTGYVEVQVRDSAQPEYYFPPDVAWDELALEQSLELLASNADAVCFGTLAQRSGTSRETIQRFLSIANQAVRLFDVNLRQTFFSADVIDKSLQLASVVKVNDEELPIVARLVRLESMVSNDQDAIVDELCGRYELDLVALTRGPRGTVLYGDGVRVEGCCETTTNAQGADGVGAGDACCAGILYGILHRWSLQQTLELANKLGAFVASCQGATPLLPQELIPAASNGHIVEPSASVLESREFGLS
jgi:fructokinase